MIQDQSSVRLLRLAGVLDKVGVSRSYWLAMVKAGEAPAPFKICPKIAVWKEREIDSWIETRLEQARMAGPDLAGPARDGEARSRGGRPRKGASVASISNA